MDVARPVASMCMPVYVIYDHASDRSKRSCKTSNLWTSIKSQPCDDPMVVVGRHMRVINAKVIRLKINAD